MPVQQSKADPTVIQISTRVIDKLHHDWWIARIMPIINDWWKSLEELSVDDDDYNLHLLETKITKVFTKLQFLMENDYQIETTRWAKHIANEVADLVNIDDKFKMVNQFDYLVTAIRARRNGSISAKGQLLNNPKLTPFADVFNAIQTAETLAINLLIHQMQI